MTAIIKTFRCLKCGEKFEIEDFVPDLDPSADKISIQADTSASNADEVARTIQKFKGENAIHSCLYDGKTKRILSCGIGEFVGFRFDKF